MDRRRSRLGRQQFMMGAGAAGLGLLAGCGPLPFQPPPPTAAKVHRLGFLNGTNPTAMYPLRQFADEGGLLAYDGSLTDLWRRVAVYVDRILKGANPADLLSSSR